MSNTTTIVITSIFPPTEAVKLFAECTGYDFIVIGDRKSPADWQLDGVDYYSVEAQLALPYRLVETLPFNHYSRKMLGYLRAIERGAEAIVDTDDDNIPKPDWAFPAWEGSFDTLPEDQGFTNVYQLYTKQKIWPRGLPLPLIARDFQLEGQLSIQEARVGIWQGLADEDPDVDAIYRLTSDEPCYFDERPPVVLGRRTISPFNTQNTLVRKELFALLYLPTYVTFRFTDILRGLIAQPIMWLYGYRLGFTNATVTQKRNPHDYMKDFMSELPMYEHTEKVMELVTAAISDKKTIEENLLLAYQALHREGIVVDKELVSLRAWLEDLTLIC